MIVQWSCLVDLSQRGFRRSRLIPSDFQRPKNLRFCRTWQSQDKMLVKFRERRTKLALIRQATIFAPQNSHSKRIVFPQRSCGRAAPERQRQFFFELPQNVAGALRFLDKRQPLEGNQPGEGGDQENEIESADTEHMYR